MAKITEQMFDAAYETGKKLHAHSISYTESIRILEVQYGMNPHSADDYVYAYINMADGKALKRTISNTAMRYYLTKFFEDQGKVRLQTALSAIQKTIDYRVASDIGSVASLRQIHNSFLVKL